MSLNDEEASHMQEAINLIECFLPLKQWNFKQSAQFVTAKYVSAVIYDSESCRIKIRYESIPGRGYERYFSIHYGRLGARGGVLPRGTKRENYHLYWHNIYYSLYFLDGLSPREANAQTEPRLIREFKQSELAKEMQNVPEKDLAMEAKIWESYGQQLFDIFDARNQDLWERYSAFVREYWDTFLEF
jgi:hypothetical protein